MGLRIVTFKIDPTVLEMLDRYCITHGISRSEAIRTAIKILIKTYKNNNHKTTLKVKRTSIK